MTITCQKCGTPNLSQAAFCQNCSSPLGGSATAPPPPWQQTPVGGPVVGGQNYVAAPPETQKAMIAMILSIAALLCCGPFTGVPGAILGWLELTAIKEGRASEKGKMMATVGLWLGIGATVIHIAIWVIWMLLGALTRLG